MILESKEEAIASKMKTSSPASVSLSRITCWASTTSNHPRGKMSPNENIFLSCVKNIFLLQPVTQLWPRPAGGEQAPPWPPAETVPLPHLTSQSASADPQPPGQCCARIMSWCSITRPAIRNILRLICSVCIPGEAIIFINSPN